MNYEPDQRSSCADLLRFEWFAENRIDNLDVAHEVSVVYIMLL
jgi:hypothetical protein